MLLSSHCLHKENLHACDALITRVWCTAHAPTHAGYSCYQSILLRLQRMQVSVPTAEKGVDQLFAPGAGTRQDLKAYLESQHPDMPSALLDFKAPAPWRSRPPRAAKPSPKQAPRRPLIGAVGAKEGSPQRCATDPSLSGRQEYCRGLLSEPSLYYGPAFGTPCLVTPYGLED